MTRISLGDIVAEVAQPRLAYLGINQNKPSTPNKAGSTAYKIVGIDGTTLYAIDTGNGHLKISTDDGANWSSSKGLPSDVTYSNLAKIVRFGSYIYAACKVTTGSAVAIFRATPTTGNTALSWSSALLTAASGTTLSLAGLCFNADDAYLYFGEYGDPTGGPSLYRLSLADANGAGTNWSNVLTLGSYRHIHGVFPDPYNPGDVWLASGDGVAEPLQRSQDHGSTWDPVTQAGGQMPQVCQVSFSEDTVFCCSDSNYSSLIVVDKATLEWATASTGYSSNTPVPSRSVGATWNPGSINDGAMTSTTVTLTGASLGTAVAAAFTTAVPAGCQLTAEVTAVDTVTVTLTNHSGQAQDLASGTLWVQTIGGTFDGSPFYGQVDPDSGCFYFVTQQNSTTAQVSGLFCVHPGGPVTLLDWGTTGFSGEMFLTDGNLWWGAFHRPVLKLTDL